MSIYGRARRGDASAVIEPFNIKKCDRVYILNRVSTREQGETDFPEAVVRNLESEVEKHGGIVVGEVEHTWSGYGNGV
jgi:hypothetical protein